MDIDQNTPESGTLPGRHEFIREPTPGEVPDDPEWNRYSDAIQSVTAAAGVAYARQDAIGTADAIDHNRGTEEPELTVGYDLQRFPVDGEGNPVGAEADGILRDEYNQPLATHCYVGREEVPGGNDDAGMRVYTVVRGGRIETVTLNNDPSEENPTLVELEYQPQRVRSYAIHQPSEATTLEISSSEDDDTMEATIESEDAEQSETISLDGTTAVTTTESFDDIDAVWLEEPPDGDVEITDGSGTTLMEIAGGLTYADGEQPVDGDRGIPALGAGSHADPIDEPYEYFVGDRVERPVGSPVRPRLQTLTTTIENSVDTDSVHSTRAPSVDTSDRIVTAEADVAGPKVSHDSMMEALQKTRNDLEHELSGGIIRLPNTIVEEPADREREASEQAVVYVGETFVSSGEPAIELEAAEEAS